ncbi:Dihydropteroate synthase [Luteitalea pratensis]|uniref:Dihydropteroate synthase n=1 Tax=Luteitalea pratensis TaxID=1855912 RepID=A0A143PH85_LUTPR|nr:dihydropteroate synthase [Luteitalea pratensis]AMY07438.1 Dihydropteroate synthase [Luteitalea pratensis]
MTPTARRRYTLALPDGRALALGTRTLVMGILNVTPDSFSDGGCHDDVPRAVEAALAMVAAGADVIDVGGESTRPGAALVDQAIERARVVPVVAALAAQLPVPISVDTTKALVARAAIDAGAVMLNDVSGLRHDAGVAAVAASAGVALVLMHMRGSTADMYRQASYVDVAKEVAAELAWSVQAAERAGVSREALVIDPGLGFAKQAGHSWEILARLDHPALLALDLPMLVGASRKSFLQAAVGECPARERDPASAAAATVAVLSGAHIVRVHDVRGSVQAVRVADMISAAAESGMS